MIHTEGCESPQYIFYKHCILCILPRSQVTLTEILQTQEHLWASLSNPGAALLELAGELFLLASIWCPDPRRHGNGWAGVEVRRPVCMGWINA